MGRGNFRVNVGKGSFIVGKKVYGTFLNERRYRVYFAPRLNKILSAEPED
jgi:hypothetical protein